MTSHPPEPEPAHESAGAETPPRRRGVARVALPLALIAAGVLGALVLLKSAPSPTPEEPDAPIRNVRTIAPAPADISVTVDAFGEVVPARQVTLEPEVSGRIVEIAPDLVPGGFLREGALIARIDPSDYRLALEQELANLQQSTFELEVEAGRQTVAEREFDLLQKELDAEDINRSLVLREPHLRLAEAMVEKAQNAIEQAKVNLDRTELTAPFNATVLAESAEIGQLVSPGTTIATLAGTDEFWVRAALQLADLQRLRMPTPESPVDATVTLEAAGDTTATWNAEVVRLLGDLQPDGRLARVLVRVPDPLGLSSAGRTSLPLLLGSYVRVEIDAGMLDGVLEIPRQAYRAGGNVWVVTAENTLDIRPAEILWSRIDTVLIDDILGPNEQIVVSDLRAALPGLNVTPQPVEPAPPAPAGDT